MFWLIALFMFLAAAMMIMTPLLKRRFNRRKNILIISTLSIFGIILAAYLLTQNRSASSIQVDQKNTNSMVNPYNNSASASLNDINNLALLLTDKLDKKPEDASGWALLARTYFKLKRYRESLPAFEKAVEMNPKDAQLLSDFADALAMSNGGYFDNYAIKIVDKALAANPSNIKGLLLKATIHFNNKEYTQAIKLWEALLKNTDINDGVRTEATNGINEAKLLMLN